MLFVLKNNSNKLQNNDVVWAKVENISKDFKELNEELIKIMELSSNRFHFPKEFQTSNSNLEVEIVRVENRTDFDLIFFVQFNRITNGLRYMVYMKTKDSKMNKDPSKMKKYFDNFYQYAKDFCPYTEDIALFLD